MSAQKTMKRKHKISSFPGHTMDCHFPVSTFAVCVQKCGCGPQMKISLTIKMKLHKVQFTEGSAGMREESRFFHNRPMQKEPPCSGAVHLRF